MSLVYLNLPIRSDAFSAFVTPAREAQSPPRKFARLEGPQRVTLDLTKDGEDGTQVKLNTHFDAVQRSLRALLTRGASQASPATYERIFKACQAIVTAANEGERLHGALRLELEKCISALAQEIAGSKAKGVQWLEVLNEAADWFQQRVNLIQSLLTYLDRVYLLEDPSKSSIKETAYKLFTHRILDYQPVFDLIQTAIKEWVSWERANRRVHELRGAVKTLVQHLVIFDRYTPLFETGYLALTEAFYAKEAADYAESLQDDATQYMAIADGRIGEEEERCEAVAAGETLTMVSGACLVAFLEKDRLAWLTAHTLDAVMPKQDADAVSVLHNMYRLIERAGGLSVLSVAYKNHLQNEVERIVKDTDKDDKMIESLLALKAFADRVVTDAFAAPGAGVDFAYCVRAAFQAGFKARRQRPAELLAKHLDRTMRRGQGALKDGAYARQLDAILALHRFTDDKDVFRTFYHRLLAKRLLLAKSASDDFEKSVIKKLNDHYDPEFHMGDHMFKDLTLSRDLMASHRGFKDESGGKQTVMVLQRSFWPFSARKQDIVLPVEMQTELDAYNAFYQKKFKGRKLEFDHSLGTATLRTRFQDRKVKEISVSLYQAAILLLFNDADALPFGDIKAATRMEDGELRRTLQSLALGKKRVLRKRTKGKDVRDDDVFEYAADFTDANPRVHIASIQAQETPEENTRTAGAIQAERGYTLDAAIVRIMKARRKLHYEALKAAVVDAVKSHFVPDVALIKKRITDLVEQEYMERDEEDMNVYTYVA